MASQKDDSENVVERRGHQLADLIERRTRDLSAVFQRMIQSGRLPAVSGTQYRLPPGVIRPPSQSGWVFIDATPDDVTSQLKACIPFWSYALSFPYCQGTLYGRCTWHLFGKAHDRVCITGYYYWLDENNVPQAGIFGDIVLLWVERLRENRVRLAATWSTIPEVVQYVGRLFGYLARCWPEIAPQLVQPNPSLANTESSHVAG